LSRARAACYVMPPTMAFPAGTGARLESALRSWAGPSLLVGAVATLVDVSVLLAAVRGLHVSNAGGAMLGVGVGSAVAFLGNRRFAFRDSATDWFPEARRFLVGTTVGMLLHGALVRALADGAGVPVVLAKLVSDVCVFSLGQLLLLRFFVFPARRGLGAYAGSRGPEWSMPEASSLEAPSPGVG
jgi:putative flippase GtrA